MTLSSSPAGSLQLQSAWKDVFDSQQQLLPGLTECLVKAEEMQQLEQAAAVIHGKTPHLLKTFSSRIQPLVI